jgi:hypothetical protein
MCRDTAGGTPSDLNYERSSIPVKLECDQIDLGLADAVEVWKGAGEAHITKHRNDTLAQRCDHLLA